jgi:hypothetical protein
MTLNFVVILLAALVPIIIGFVWYHPKVLGKFWMDASGMTEEKVNGGNMMLIFGLAYVFAVLMGVEISFIVIHQHHIGSLFFGMVGQDEAVKAATDAVNALTEHNHRTFSHGVFHGTVAGIFFALPLIDTNALFERKGFKYIAVNGGYWILALALMGGVICQFS